ncbi:MAG: response regulator [Candidatus Margulisbacteria bacterium]|nr:response regulator [Candidatus Margulisiibacteriota bacterium]
MKKILVIDDSPIIRKIMHQYIQILGYECDQAESGMQAMEQVKNNDYVLIFTDIHMPQMDGFVTSKNIREIEDSLHKQHAPIIAITGTLLEEYTDKYKIYGINDCIRKPVEKSNILEILAKFVESKELRLSPTEPAETQSANDNLIPINLKQVVSEFSGDRKMVVDILKEFLEISGEQIQQIKQAVVKGDYQIVKNLSHSIKGGSANLCAPLLSAAAKDLEMMVISGHNEDAKHLVNKLVREHICLQDYYRKVICNENNDC